MYKKFGRYSALAAIIAITLFAGQSYATLHNISLFKKTPAETPVVSQDVPLINDANIADSLAQTTTSTSENINSGQTVPVDTTINSTPTTNQQFRIKTRVNDDD